MKSYSAVGLAVAATLLSAGAIAQETSALEEIIVTATKRAQTLQDVPVAVSVTPVETINKASIKDISDLASIVTSLRVSTLQTSTNTNFIIRGFGNGANNPGIEPSVGLFIDGVYRSRSAGAIGDLVDVERVEVLRGPQSTLFGQNASAG
ncbi:MAG: TonB-dependent receptor plug domain-containing protein, partial [Steroidobacteraceae bacterium]